MNITASATAPRNLAQIVEKPKDEFLSMIGSVLHRNKHKHEFNV